ncbi:MAG: DUF6382 domain-containing protein [Clostridiales bacterium]
MSDQKKVMQIINDDENNNLIILVDSEEQILEYQIDMIKNNNIRLLTPKIGKQDDKRILRYDLNDYDLAFSNLEKSKNKVKVIFEGLFDINEIISNCEKYLLFQECLLLNKNFLFRRKSNGCIYLLYIPIKRNKKSDDVYKSLSISVINSFIYSDSENLIIQTLVNFIKRNDFTLNLWGHFLEKSLISFNKIDETGNDYNNDNSTENSIKMIENTENNYNTDDNGDSELNFDSLVKDLKNSSNKHIINNKLFENNRNLTVDNNVNYNENENELVSEPIKKLSKPKRNAKLVTTENNLSRKINKIKDDNNKNRSEPYENREANDDLTLSIKREYEIGDKNNGLKIYFNKYFIGFSIQVVFLMIIFSLSKNKDLIEYLDIITFNAKLSLFLFALIVSIFIWSTISFITNKLKNEVVMSKYDIWNIPNPGELDKLINNSEYKEKLSDFVTVKVDDYYDYPYLESEYQGTYERIFITKSVFNIGKTFDKSDYILNSEKIDNLHARILRTDREYYLIDLSKENKTFINDEKLKGKQKVNINNNDKIRFADISFTFNV